MASIKAAVVDSLKARNFHIKSTFFGYLNASSVHGMQYLSQGWNFIEKLTWLIAIVFSLTFAGHMIQDGIQEAADKPMLVTLETEDVNEVPFPAITISAESNGINAIGFPTKFMDAYTFNDIEDEDAYDQSKELRKDMSPVVAQVLRVYKSAIYSNCHDLKNLTNCVSDLYKKQANELVGKVAAIYHSQSLVDIEEMEKEVMTIMQESFFLATTPNYFMSKVDQYIKKFQLTPCGPAGNDCSDSEWLNGQELVTFPFIYYEHRFTERMGLGSFVSNFQNELTHEVTDGFINCLFESSANGLTNSEIVLRKLWNSMLYNLKADMADFDLATTFDLVAILDQRTTICYQSARGLTLNFPLIMNCDYEFFQTENLDSDFIKSANNTESCLKMLDLFQYSLSTVLKVFRYAIQAPELYESMDELNEVYSNLSFLPNYTLWQPKGVNYFNWYDVYDYNEDTDDARDILDEMLSYNAHAMVINCTYAGQPCPSNSFHRSFTNKGIGFSFNMGNFWDLFQSTNFTRTFASIMKPKGHDKPSSVEECFQDPECAYPTSGILYPQSSGVGNSLELLLHVGQPMHEISPSDRVFEVSIHDPMILPDLRTSVVTVRPGYVTTFYITPTFERTTDDSKSMSVNERNCKFRPETDSDLFKTHTRNGCLMECQLKKAFNKSGCIPWNYPHFMENQPICNRTMQYEFEGVMSDQKETNACECDLDCIKTTYAYFYSMAKFEDVGKLDKLCKPLGFSGFQTSLIGNGWLERAYHPFFWYYDALKARMKKQQDLERCEYFVSNNIAVVNFQLVTPTVNRLERSQRVTLTGYLAFIGGTLGLFSGISLLSLFEIFFWMVRFFRTDHN